LFLRIMRIAVIEHAEAGDYAEYISSLINERAKQNNYQIKTWSNSVPAFQQQVAGNAVIHIYIESKSPILLSWLYNVKIPSILKKTKAEVVVDLNGVASDKIKIPQFIVAAETFFHNNTKHLNSIEKFAFKHLNNSVKIAKNIFAYSKRNLNVNDIKQDALQPILFSAPAIFRTYEWHEKIMVKAQQADNKEYFIAVIEDNNADDFVLLLQAFTKFKKWQQSSMQLLVFAKYESLGEDIIEKHKTYKHREDVRLIEDIEEKQTSAIIASAYALIHVAEVKPDLLIIAVALQCSLPVISSENDDVKEYAGNAVLYCSEKTPEAFGNTLLQLYKDENLHAQLKEKAQQQSAFLKREECENKIWQLLETAAHS
ncbi:MAG TPA: glycosyltransferase, partial [Parafilimonas sp.]